LTEFVEHGVAVRVAFHLVGSRAVRPAGEQRVGVSQHARADALVHRFPVDHVVPVAARDVGDAALRVVEPELLRFGDVELAAQAGDPDPELVGQGEVGVEPGEDVGEDQCPDLLPVADVRKQQGAVCRAQRLSGRQIEHLDAGISARVHVRRNRLPVARQ
jgi:hypothetical protein